MLEIAATQVEGYFAHWLTMAELAWLRCLELGSKGGKSYQAMYQDEATIWLLITWWLFVSGYGKKVKARVDGDILYEFIIF